MAAPDNQALADFLARHGKPDDADTDSYGARDWPGHFGLGLFEPEEKRE
jgi:hypothetical protein